MREFVDIHTARMIKHHRWLSIFAIGLAVLSGGLIAGTTLMALKLWQAGTIELGCGGDGAANDIADFSNIIACCPRGDANL